MATVHSDEVYAVIQPTILEKYKKIRFEDERLNLLIQSEAPVQAILRHAVSLKATSDALRIQILIDIIETFRNRVAIAALFGTSHHS